MTVHIFLSCNGVLPSSIKMLKLKNSSLLFQQYVWPSPGKQVTEQELEEIDFLSSKNLITCLSLEDVKCYSWCFFYLVITTLKYSVPRLEQYCGRCYRSQKKKDFDTVVVAFLTSALFFLASSKVSKRIIALRVSAVLPVK